VYFFYIFEVNSTQNHSKALNLLHSAGVSFWVQSRYQTCGRGQRGRSWSSFDGNLFLTGSFLLPKTNILGQFSIMTGVFLAKILQLFLPDQRMALKWPNDLLCDHKKIGGILMEVEDSRVYVGIGINIVSHPDGTNMPSTHAQAYNNIDMDALIKKIMECLPGFWALENFEKIREEWWLFAKDSVLFWKVREPLEGEIIGIDEQGQLLMVTKNGDIAKRHQAFTE